MTELHSFIACTVLCLSTFTAVRLVKAVYWPGGFGKAIHRNSVASICELSRNTRCVMDFINGSENEITGKLQQIEVLLNATEVDLKYLNESIRKPEVGHMEGSLFDNIKLKYGDAEGRLGPIRNLIDKLNITLATRSSEEGAVSGAMQKIDDMNVLIFNSLFKDMNGGYCVGDGHNSSVRREDIPDCNRIGSPAVRINGRCPPLKFPPKDPEPGSSDDVKCRVTTEHSLPSATFTYFGYLKVKFEGEGRKDITVTWDEYDERLPFSTLQTKYETVQGWVDNVSSALAHISSLREEVADIRKLAGASSTPSTRHALGILLIFSVLPNLAHLH
ncbi:hypothetical protein, conserved in T.vivax [Trypanosoma vivax Y486]|uniref:Uncharacterized protein n=1 Tax=Trypanosoma vivax (strain Y486) TaxID=1055687 RepID=F9WVL1_TRYVY|nr:hypothetical protein, conserved in T.vivax [Trypanosoma vivax Y486]|eukprot:CCD21619.1 hypothetical protein, conserved in T.vivax [Trypanosoma vivax Y486]